MKLTLHWNNGLIYHEEMPVGDFMNDEIQSNEYKLNKCRLQFESIDVSKKQVAIMDENRNRLGMIYKSRWSKSAKIKLNDEDEYELRPAGLLSSRWKLFAKNNELIEFTKRIFRKGEINYIFQDELLILAGLYVLND
ncbi:hypothetical protein [Fulvivirga lutea]|uniref:Uncharacterized protein n=1 Tax=Fulvivirga lutea TaxID=2810512 RepID=A0A974WHM1_9BACT|nr:hypothetical protein [Fulvivirga lutea]QSE98714.1 hypothetical protein JR347_06435 [Fulvivirga lutea]